MNKKRFRDSYLHTYIRSNQSLSIVLILLLLAMGVPTRGQINSPSAAGWIERARLMQADGNYKGCVDQLSEALKMPLQADQKEEALYRQASAMVHVDKSLAEDCLQQFINAYPASIYRNEALVDLGDCYFGSDNNQALNLYLQVNADEINPNRQETLIYRKAYCYMQLGFMDDALAQFKLLDNSKEYASAAIFYQGYIAYRQGKYQQARELLESVKSSKAPGNMADYYLCQIYYMQGNYRNALNTAKAVIEKSQNQDIDSEFLAESYRIAGESEYRLDHKTNAWEYLEKYVKMTTAPLPSALYILGLMEYTKGNYAKAVQYMTPATEAGDAMSQSAYLYIGQALLKEGDMDGAILAFDNSLAMGFDPGVQETAYFNYAVASLQGGKVPFGNAVGTFENFLRRYPNSSYAPQAQEYIISAYLKSNNYEAALKSINAMANPTTETNRAKQRVLYMLGAQALNANAPAKAIDYLSQAKKLSQYDTEVDREVSLLLGEAYYRGGNYAQSVSQLQRYINSDPVNSQNKAIAYYDLGYSQFAQKAYSDAATSFMRMLSTPNALPNNILADAYGRLGDCHYYLHQFAQAAEAYDKSYNLNPESGDYALLQKALMEGYQRRHKQKIALLDQLQTQFPQSALIPDAMLEKTESYIQLGDNAGAIKVYQELVRKYPNTSQGRQGFLQMALTMLNAGQKQEAIEAYKQVVTLYPSSDEALQAAEQLKRIYADDGKLGEFMTFINNVPNAPRMEASEADNLTFEIAEKLYITENNPARLEQYIKEYPEGANRPKALSYLMEHAWAQGNDAQAYDYATAIVEGYPDNALALDALAVMAQYEYGQGKGSKALRTWQLLEQKASTPYLLNMSRMGIARIASEMNEDQQALDAASAALSSASLSTADRCEALYIKGMAEYHQGNTEAARRDWQQAANVTSDYNGMGAAFAIAQSYFDADELAKAEELAKDITNADTPFPYWTARAFILLSDVYALQGDDFKAQQYLKSLKENYPGTEEDIFKMIEQRIK